MSKIPRFTRREFLASTAAAAAGLTLADRLPAEEADALHKPMPMRVLGRTGVRVSMLAFGAAPLGHSFQPQEVFDRVVGEALDLGVNYVDTAVTYDISQERLGPIVKRNRERMFLVSKTRGKTKAEAIADIEKSLRLLQTDHLDLVHLHNVPDLEASKEKLLEPDSPLAGLQEAQKRGLVRFLGATAHYQVPKMLPAIETGLLDVVMAAMNYFDQHTYAFETRMLPAAREHKCGIIAMKVFGGPPNWSYRTPTPPIVAPERVPHAIRYCLSIPDVAAANIGFHTVEQVRQAVTVVKTFTPLTDEERASLADEGKALAAKWKEHLGPAG